MYSCVYIYICMHIYIYIQTHTHTHTHAHTHIYIYMYMYVCMYLFIYLYIYIYIHRIKRVLHQLCYYACFRRNTLGKGMNPLPPCYGLNSTPTFYPE